MEEIKLNSKEISKLDNSGFEELAVYGKITKEEIVALSSEKREKLKQVLSTNAELGALLSAVKGTLPTESVPSNPSQVEFDGRMKKEGYSDLYILIRGLELGYMPKYHDITLKGIKDSPTKIRTGWNYIADGMGFTGNGILSRAPELNNKTLELLKKFGLDAVDFERAQAKELLSLAKNISTIDKALIDNHFDILKRVEDAINSGDAGRINAAFREYKNNFGKEKTHGFKTFADKYRVNLSLSGLDIEKTAQNARIQNMNNRVRIFEADNSLVNLFNNRGHIEEGDEIKILKKGTNSDYMKVKVTGVSRAGYEVQYAEYINDNISGKTGKGRINFGKNGVQIINQTGSFTYLQSDRFEIKADNSVLLKRQASLDAIEAEIKKNPIDINKIRELRKKYETDFGNIIPSQNKTKKTESAKDALRESSVEVKALKKEVLAIDAEIERLKNEAIELTKKLDTEAKKDPAKIKEYQKKGKTIVDDLNKQIVELEKRGVNLLSNAKIDSSAIKNLSSESKLVNKLVEYNQDIDKCLKYGKWVVGASVFSIVFNSKGGIAELWKGGEGRKEVTRDLGDLAIGILPIAGGVHDLLIAGRNIPGLPDGMETWYRELFGNKHQQMSASDKNIRTGFGVVGLIPGAGFISKAIAKGGKGMGLISASSKVMHGVDVTIEASKLGGKMFTFGALGYSLVETFIPLVYSPSKK